MNKLLLNLTLAGALAAGTAQAAVTVNIDLSMFNDQTPSPYNNVQLVWGNTTGSVADLIDTNAASTGWSFNFSSTGPALNGVGNLTAPTEVSAIFASTAYADTIRLHATGAATWTQTFGGLDNSQKYAITIWAKNNNSATATSADYALTVGTAESTSTLTGLDLRNGTLTTLSGVTPDEGVITWTVASSNDFGLALNAIQIAVVPEPSTYAALLGALALGFVAWRRRRS